LVGLEFSFKAIEPGDPVEKWAKPDPPLYRKQMSKEAA